MEYIKYKGILAKVISRDTYSLKILSQSPQTFTHLSFYVTEKMISEVEKVTHLTLNQYLQILDNKDFFKDVKNLSEKREEIIMELVLEQASEELVWIEDLHHVDYRELIISILNSSLI